MTLVFLRRFAELLCTCGRLLNRPQLLSLGAELWNLVERRRSDLEQLEHGRVTSLNLLRTAPSTSSLVPDSNNVHKAKEFLNSLLFKEVMLRANNIEPEIGGTSLDRSVYLAPHHDILFTHYRKLKALLPAGPIDTIVCVPWIRTGGADLVACHIADALKTLDKGRVVICRVDHPNFEREDWVPSGVATLDFSGVLSQVTDEHAEMLLYTVFMGVRPSRILNVNSRKCWNTFRRFGPRLLPYISLYAYLFCWDQTALGDQAGYPTDYFPTTVPFLRGLFTDTFFLRDELVRLYRPPQSLRERIVILRSPARGEPTQVIAAEEGARSSTTRARPRILWAGRLDQQKRFDLVIEIARLAPDWDFSCWGEPLLNPAPNCKDLPSNLSLSRNFRSLDDLPLHDSDCWLFTSAWEGLPTLLIELASRGAAIVATAVGGVPELVDETTGWPVPTGSGAEIYIRVLQEALSNPDSRIKRAGLLQERVRRNHSPHLYAKCISDFLEWAESSSGVAKRSI